MRITIDYGAMLVHWPRMQLLMLVDPGRAWVVHRGRVIGRVLVGEC